MSELDELAQARQQTTVRRRPAASEVRVDVRHAPGGQLRALAVLVGVLVVAVCLYIGWRVYQERRAEQRADEAVKQVEKAFGQLGKEPREVETRKALDEHFPGGVVGLPAINAAVDKRLPNRIQSITAKSGGLVEKRMVYEDAGVYLVVEPDDDFAWVIRKAVDIKTDRAIELADAASRIVSQP